jgi:hypothetical protein
MTSTRRLWHTLAGTLALVWAVVAAAGTPVTLTTVPVPLSFGPQPLNTTSPPATETYTVTGVVPGSAMAINSISASGDFAIAGGTCKTGPLNAVPFPGSCTVLVTVTPTGLGTRNGTLTLNCTTIFLIGGGAITCGFGSSNVLVPLLGTGIVFTNAIPALSPQLIALLAGLILLWSCWTLGRRRD